MEFGIYKHLSIFQSLQMHSPRHGLVAFEQLTRAYLINPNCIRNHVITFPYSHVHMLVAFENRGEAKKKGFTLQLSNTSN